MRVCHRGASFGYKSHQNSIHGGAEILVPWPDYAQLFLKQEWSIIMCMWHRVGVEDVVGFYGL